MADILQITEDIPVDDSIYEYKYKEYNPIVGTNLNRGSIVLTIESQDIYTHPSESFLVIEGQLLKNDDTVYDDDHVALINNGMMYLFSDVRFHLASHEIEVLQNPGHATTMLGMFKYPDDFYKSSYGLRMKMKERRKKDLFNLLIIEVSILDVNILLELLTLLVHLNLKYH